MGCSISQKKLSAKWYLLRYKMIEVNKLYNLCVWILCLQFHSSAFWKAEKHFQITKFFVVGIYEKPMKSFRKIQNYEAVVLVFYQCRLQTYIQSEQKNNAHVLILPICYSKKKKKTTFNALAHLPNACKKRLFTIAKEHSTALNVSFVTIQQVQRG